MIKLDVLIPSCKSELELSKTIGEILMADNDINIIYVCSNASAAVNRNKCLNLAKSEYVVMVDDDITGFFSGWAFLLVSALISNPNTAYVSARLLNTDGTPQRVMGYNNNILSPTVEVSIAPSACIAFRNDGTRFNEEMLGSQFEDTSFHYRLVDSNKGKYPGWKVLVHNGVKLIHKNEAKGKEYYSHNKKIFTKEFPNVFV